MAEPRPARQRPADLEMSARAEPRRPRPALRLAVAWALAFAPLAALAETPINGQGLLWRIEAPGAAASHLFGTMHSADERVLAMPAAARQAFEAADIVALELLIASPEAEQELAGVIGPGIALTDGRSLDRIIGRDPFNQVADVLRRFDVPRVLVRGLKPWAAYLMMNAPPPRRDAEGNDIPALDQRLELDARAGGKELLALETFAEQATLLESRDEAIEVELLENLIAQGQRVGGLPRYMDAMFALIIDLYVTEDIGTILEVATPPMPKAQQIALDTFIERALNQRNRVMAERMAPLIARGNAFVAVGAAHLPGQAGLVNLLAKKGYTISRVP